MSFYEHDQHATFDRFVFERIKVYSKQYLSLFPMLEKTVSLQRMYQDFDRSLDRSFVILAQMAQGETTSETRTVTEKATFQVFASWTDHLKFRLKGKLPPWLAIRLTVRYQVVTKEVSVTVPVTIIRACPHPYTEPSERHVYFLLNRKETR